MCIPGTGCVFLLWSLCGQWPQGSTFFSITIIWEMFNNSKNEQAWQSTMLCIVWACCPPVTPHQGFKPAGRSQHFYRDPSACSTGQALLCFVSGHTSIATKADTRKAELQEKNVTSLPYMPGGQRQVWSCIYGISLDSSCRHTVRPCG